jgi:hypothetical protein
MHAFWKFFWKAVLGVLINTENQKNPVSSEPGNELVTTLPTSVNTDVQFCFDITRHCHSTHRSIVEAIVITLLVPLNCAPNPDAATAAAAAAGAAASCRRKKRRVPKLCHF